eukprot:c18137_g1_i1.p1 GENE.c18137_g1_i1~~c18137_g1_i1.p1  ORF type:complete len:136 (+),score=26.20 c18137_g1_i1:64-471(+)
MCNCDAEHQRAFSIGFGVVSGVVLGLAAWMTVSTTMLSTTPEPATAMIMLISPLQLIASLSLVPYSLLPCAFRYLATTCVHTRTHNTRTTSPGIPTSCSHGRTISVTCFDTCTAPDTAASQGAQAHQHTTSHVGH